MQETKQALKYRRNRNLAESNSFIIIWANPNILFCDKCAVNSDEPKDEISGQNTTEYSTLAFQSCKNATLYNFACFKCTYIKTAAQLHIAQRIKIWHYEVIYEGILLARQGTLSVLTLERNIQWACWRKQAGAPGKVKGWDWTRQGDAKELFIPSAQARTLQTLGCPSKDKKVLEKH